MILKKINSVLSLLTFALLLLHMGYTAYAYLAFYYNPVLTKAFAIPLMVLMCLHGVLGMCSLFLLGDGTRAALYSKQNLSTVVQRVSAALIFPLLIIHINTYSLLGSTSASGQYFLFALIMLAQILFYSAIVSHSAVSFGKALVTLGALSSARALRIIDRVIYIMCAALLVLTAFAVIKYQITAFLLS